MSAYFTRPGAVLTDASVPCIQVSCSDSVARPETRVNCWFTWSFEMPSIVTSNWNVPMWRSTGVMQSSGGGRVQGRGSWPQAGTSIGAWRKRMRTNSAGNTGLTMTSTVRIPLRTSTSGLFSGSHFTV